MCVKTALCWDKTTAQSNSHLIFTYSVKHDQNEVPLCGGLTCSNNVFIFHLKLLPSALLLRGIAYK